MFEQRRILRSGENIRLPRPAPLVNGITGHDRTSSPNDELALRVDTVEPVLQGYIQKDLTRLVVLLADHPSPTHPHADSDGEDIVDDSDAEIEIDESFLAGSTASLSYTTYAPDSSHNGANGVASSPLRRRSHEPLVLNALPRTVSSAIEDVAVYLKTADLGRLGLLHGDWVRVHRLPLPLCLPLVRPQYPLHPHLPRPVSSALW